MINKTTAEIKVPKKIAEQVIGQDSAIDIIKKAAKQHRHVLLIGEPGTGKSLIGQALAELMPMEKLVDILVYPNVADENTPLIKTVPKGQGKTIVTRAKLQAMSSFKNQNIIMFTIIIIISLIPYYFWKTKQISDVVYAASMISSMVFIVGFILFLNLGKKMKVGENIAIPKLLIDNSEKKESPFYDATGAHAGALLGDCLHDPLQSGGLGTPAHERIIPGMIHRANGGVLFIDEIATLQPITQQELLTAMQEKKYPITGQSERSSGAMTRTEAVPCLVPDTLINIDGKKYPIGEYIDNMILNNNYIEKNDTKIIASFKESNKTLSFNKSYQKDIPLLAYKTKYKGEILDIELEDGTILSVTPDHPILTSKGFIKGCKLELNEEIIKYDGEDETIIDEIDIIDTYSKEQQRMAFAYLAYCKLSKEFDKHDVAELLHVDESTIRNWIKGAKPRAIQALEFLTINKLCPLKVDDERMPLVARISGVLFGDGGVARERIYFCTGLKAKKDIEDFLKDIITIFGRDIKKNVHIRNTGRGFDISICNAYIARLFSSIGVPKNDKVSQSFCVPKWIYKKEEFEYEFFSSLISSELYGNIKSISNSLSFTMAKVKKLEKSHIHFLEEIISYLKKNSIKVSSIKKSQEYLKKVNGNHEKAARYYFRFARSHEELLKFLDNVNILYANHKKKALHMVAIQSKNYIKEQKRLNKAYNRIPEFRRQGLSIRTIAKILCLNKNSVLKKVDPTYRKYTTEFKSNILKQINTGINYKFIASSHNIPITTIRYWCKNEEY